METSNTELIALIIAAATRKDWEAYATLKTAFFARLQASPWLAEEAQRAARWAGLATF